jgi:hypothetical protein
MPDELAEAPRRRSSALAILEVATIREVIAEQTEVRLRAEQRARHVLTKMILDWAESIVGARRKERVTQGPTFSAMLRGRGISHLQAARWLRLAAVPEGRFSRKVVKRVALAVAGPTSAMREVA